MNSSENYKSSVNSLKFHDTVEIELYLGIPILICLVCGRPVIYVLILYELGSFWIKSFSCCCLARCAINWIKCKEQSAIVNSYNVVNVIATFLFTSQTIVVIKHEPLCIVHFSTFTLKTWNSRVTAISMLHTDIGFWNEYRFVNKMDTENVYIKPIPSIQLKYK